MRAKWTRRELAAAMAASAALHAQTPSPPPSADEELKAAREEIRQSAEQLARFPLPMGIEPASHFKA